MSRALVATLSLIAACNALAAQRVDASMSCVSFDDGPQLECTVALRQSARPLAGATVKLSADMPSMPMVHAVRPVAAAPTSTPGEYRGVLTLEMEGTWAVMIDVSATALRDRVVKTVNVFECEPSKRCPALPPKSMK